MIRCYVIADDYRWHFVSKSIQEFSQATLAYLHVMSTSKKENSYYFKNVFLEEKEYERIRFNIENKIDDLGEQDRKYYYALQRQKMKKAKLHLVKS